MRSRRSACWSRSCWCDHGRDWLDPVVALVVAARSCSPGCACSPLLAGARGRGAAGREVDAIRGDRRARRRRGGRLPRAASEAGGQPALHRPARPVRPRHHARARPPLGHDLQDAIGARVGGADVLIHLEPEDRVRPGEVLRLRSSRARGSDEPQREGLSELRRREVGEVAARVSYYLRMMAAERPPRARPRRSRRSPAGAGSRRLAGKPAPWSSSSRVRGPGCHCGAVSGRRAPRRLRRGRRSSRAEVALRPIRRAIRLRPRRHQAAPRPPGRDRRDGRARARCRSVPRDPSRPDGPIPRVWRFGFPANCGDLTKSAPVTPVQRQECAAGPALLRCSHPRALLASKIPTTSKEGANDEVRVRRPGR